MTTKQTHYTHPHQPNNQSVNIHRNNQTWTHRTTINHHSTNTQQVKQTSNQRTTKQSLNQHPTINPSINQHPQRQHQLQNNKTKPTS